ncbi:MAG TPA: CAP domain-containing protein [Candidatus Limnocylindrales bacterium]|nr:CAP domain-containing protein [Candidatus Limnocylindrales bacterium]
MVRPSPRGRALRHLLAISVLAAAVATGIGPIAHPADARAATPAAIEAKLLTLINDARTAKGLVPLRGWAKLNTLAGDRATTMAKNNVMAHPSCLTCVYDKYGISYYRASEVIAWSSYPDVAQTVFNAWKASSIHWAILMSTTLNYIGLGAAVSSSGRTYVSGDLSESKDHSLPWSKMGGVSRNGTTVSWSWTGADTKLQTHTAGLKNFDVQYRVGTGTWTTVRSGTTARSLSLSGRAHGHYYGLRVRSRDNLGYVSAWTAEMRIWVP